MLRKLLPYSLPALLMIALLAWNYRANYGRGRQAPEPLPGLAPEVALFAAQEKLRATLESDAALILEGAQARLMRDEQVEIDLGALRDCYALARWDNPKMGDGKVALSFQVTSSPLSPPEMRHFKILEKASTIRDAGLYACIERCARTWKIAPRLRLGQEFQLTFTFQSWSRGASGRGQAERADLPPNAVAEAEVEAAQVGRAAPQDKAAAAAGQADGAAPGADDEPAAIAAQIEAVFLQHSHEVEYCRAKAQMRGISVSDWPSVTFEVAADGSVARVVEIDSGQSTSTLFDTCLQDYLLTWRFPAPGGDASLRVRHRPLFDSRGSAGRPFDLALSTDLGDLEIAFEKPKAPPLTQAQVSGVVERHLGDLDACLHGKRRADSFRFGFGRNGRIDLQFTVESTGRVSGTGVRVRGNIGGPGLTQCLSGALRKWRFPPFRKGAAMAVSYPLQLGPPKMAKDRREGEPHRLEIRPPKIESIADQVRLTAVGERRAIERVLSLKAQGLKKCRSAGIAFERGALHPIPLHFELAPNGRALAETIAFGERALPAQDAQAAGAAERAGPVAGDWRASSDEVAARFERCITQKVAGWRFAPIPGGGKASVRYPMLMAAERERHAEIEQQMKQVKALQNVSAVGVPAARQGSAGQGSADGAGSGERR